MAVEIILKEKAQELQRIRVPYNGRGLFDVLNETLSLADLEAFSWGDYKSDESEYKLDEFETKDLHHRLMNALADIMLVDVWRYPTGAPLSTVEKMEIQNLHVELLCVLNEVRRCVSRKTITVIA